MLAISREIPPDIDELVNDLNSKVRVASSETGDFGLIAGTIKTETTFEKFGGKKDEPMSSRKLINMTHTERNDKDGDVNLMDAQENVEIQDFAEHGILSKTKYDETPLLTPQQDIISQISSKDGNKDRDIR
jgi:hypothetical protein